MAGSGAVTGAVVAGTGVVVALVAGALSFCAPRRRVPGVVLLGLVLVPAGVFAGLVGAATGILALLVGTAAGLAGLGLSAQVAGVAARLGDVAATTAGRRRGGARCGVDDAALARREQGRGRRGGGEAGRKGDPADEGASGHRVSPSWWVPVDCTHRRRRGLGPGYGAERDG